MPHILYNQLHITMQTHAPAQRTHRYPPVETNNTPSKCKRKMRHQNPKQTLRLVRIRTAWGASEAVRRPRVGVDSVAHGDGPMRQAIGLEVIY